MSKHEVQRDCGQIFGRGSETLFDRFEFWLKFSEVFFGEAFVAAPVISGNELRWIVGAELVEQEPFREWAEGDQTEVVLIHEGLKPRTGPDELIVEGVSPGLKHVWLDLRDETFEVFGAVGRLSLEADFALLNEAVHDVDCIVEIAVAGAEISVVEVVEIDRVAIEIDERLLALVTDMLWLEGVFGRSAEPSNLCGNDDFGAFDADSIEHPSEHTLGAAISVDIGVVEVVHAGIDSNFDGVCYFIFVDLGPAVGLTFRPTRAAHGPAAEADS